MKKNVHQQMVLIEINNSALKSVEKRRSG